MHLFFFVVCYLHLLKQVIHFWGKWAVQADNISLLQYLEQLCLASFRLAFNTCISFSTFHVIY